MATAYYKITDLQIVEQVKKWSESRRQQPRPKGRGLQKPS